MAPKDFNATRSLRATSERRFSLGPYTLTRRVSVPPEAVIGFQQAVTDASGDDALALEAMEKTISALCEPDAIVTESGDSVSFDDAWRVMRSDGDANGPLDIRDLGDIVEWLVAGVTERPTGQPSDSPDGSPTPETGTTSTGDSPSPARALTISTPDGASTLSAPA